MYAAYDDVSGCISFQRVPYDHSAAAKAIRMAALSEFLPHGWGWGHDAA